MNATKQATVPTVIILTSVAAMVAQPQPKPADVRTVLVFRSVAR